MKEQYTDKEIKWILIHSEHFINKYEAELAENEFNITQLMAKSVGVAEHPDIKATIDGLYIVGAKIREKLEEAEILYEKYR